MLFHFGGLFFGLRKSGFSLRSLKSLGSLMSLKSLRSFENHRRCFGWGSDTKNKNTPDTV